MPHTSARSAAPLSAFLLALSLLAPSRTARGNGRFPAAQHVVIGPGASSDVIAMRVTFGVLLPHARRRGATWSGDLGCRAAHAAAAKAPSGGALEMTARLALL